MQTKGKEATMLSLRKKRHSHPTPRKRRAVRPRQEKKEVTSSSCYRGHARGGAPTGNRDGLNDNDLIGEELFALLYIGLEQGKKKTRRYRRKGIPFFLKV